MVQSTRESLESITQNYNSDGAQSSKNPHKFDRLVELESLVDAKIDEQIAMKAEILETIMKLPDRRQRLVLMEYYVEMKSFEEVSVHSLFMETDAPNSRSGLESCAGDA